MRKGLCSNDLTACHLARDKAELPYAGLGSICPECGAPLAAIAPAATFDGPDRPAATPPAKDLGPPEPSWADTSRPSETAAFEEPPRARSTGAVLKWSQIVIFGAALALLGFFVWQMYLAPRPVEPPELDAQAAAQALDTGPVTSISPPQIRRLVTAAQILSAPDLAGSVLATLSPGTIIDVTGIAARDGVTWLRLTIPNAPASIGFVREDQTAMMGDASVLVAPQLAPGQSTLTRSEAQTPSVEPGPVQVLAPMIQYIGPKTANVRAEALGTAAILATFEFSDPITVVGQRQAGSKTWLQVQLPSGGTGWINAELVTATPLTSPRKAVTGAGLSATKAREAEPNSGDDEAPSSPPPPPSGDGTSQRAYDVGTKLKITAQKANLRAAPDTSSDNGVEIIKPDVSLNVEDVRIVDGLAWYKVTTPTQTQGWISGRIVTQDK